MNKQLERLQMLSRVSATGLRVDNVNNKNIEQYNLNGPYMLVYENFDCTSGNALFSMIAPGFFQWFQEELRSESMKTRSLHQHNFFEIMYVVHGQVTQQIEDQQYHYQAGQCCLLNHNIRHLERAEQNTELFFLTLSDDFLKTLIQADMHFDDKGHIVSNMNPIYELFLSSYEQNNPHYKQYWDFLPIVPAEEIVPALEQLFGNMIKETVEHNSGFYLVFQGLVSRIFSIMLDPRIYTYRKVSMDSTQDEYLFSHIQMIMQECHGRISRKELEEKLNYNSHYLNKIVHNCMDMSLLEYGRIFTLKEAARLLSQTNDSITDIMKQLNFSNRSHFYSIFKQQYGVTPKDYRDGILQQTV